MTWSCSLLRWAYCAHLGMRCNFRPVPVRHGFGVCRKRAFKEREREREDAQQSMGSCWAGGGRHAG